MKKIILIILLSCLLGGTQLWGAKKLEADSPLREYLKRMKEDPEYLTRLLMNQANENARQYQEESLEALANPTPVKAKTDFGSQSIDYSLVSNGFVPSDLLYDQDLLNKKRTEIKKKRRTRDALIVFSTTVIGFSIFCMAMNRKKFSDIDTNEKS